MTTVNEELMFCTGNHNRQVSGNESHKDSNFEKDIQDAIRRLKYIIGDKKCTLHDFYTTLRQCPHKSSLMSSFQDNGLNLLQYCVDKCRISFLPALVYLGWWQYLASQKVSEDAPSEHKGKTAKQIAESKRTRKLLEEFNSNQEWEQSLTALMKSCRASDITRARQLLESGGVDIFTLDHNHGNALYWAVVSGHLEMFEELANMGLDVNMRTKKRETLLHIACMLGQHHMIRLLVEKYQLDPSVKDISHKICHDRVAENGDIETLKSLINCGIQPKSNALSLAAFANRQEFVVYLLDVQQTPIDSADMYDRTALHRCLESGNANIAKFLVNKGANLSLSTKMGRNILHIAAEEGNVDTMKWLVSVLEEKHILTSLIDVQDRYNGVDLCFLIRGRDKGRDAFHYVEVERTKVPRFLKETKAGNVDVADFGKVLKSDWGVNPSQEVVDEIEETFKCRRLNKSADLDQTPLQVAIAKNHFEVAKFLIEKGADIHVLDKFGQTPVFLAVSRGCLELVTLLEQKGADLNLLDYNRKSLVDIAEDNQQDSIMNFLSAKSSFDIVENFRVGSLERLSKTICKEKLEAERNNGTNIKQFLTEQLREITTEINKLLVNLDSGPVAEETGDGRTVCILGPQQEISIPSLPSRHDSGIASTFYSKDSRDSNHSEDSLMHKHRLEPSTYRNRPDQRAGSCSVDYSRIPGDSVNSNGRSSLANNHRYSICMG